MKLTSPAFQKFAVTFTVLWDCWEKDHFAYNNALWLLWWKKINKWGLSFQKCTHWHNFTKHNIISPLTWPFSHPFCFIRLVEEYRTIAMQLKSKSGDYLLNLEHFKECVLKEQANVFYYFYIIPLSNTINDDPS